MDSFAKAIGYLYEAELIDLDQFRQATLEEAQALADRETNPNWWKVWR